MTDSNGELIQRLERIRRELLVLGETASKSISEASPAFTVSARNLVHYIGLRQHDLRPLQDQLAELGLSSLGRSESHVMANLDMVLGHLRRMTGPDNHTAKSSDLGPSPVPSYGDGQSLLNQHTQDLFGRDPDGRRVRIMVTMPGEAANSPTLIRDWIQEGMDCIRINCAHDDPAIWERMIDRVRVAEKELGKTCRVLMDLGGPKLRTGELPHGPQVIKVRPMRDDCGRVLQPGKVWLSASPGTAPIGCTFIPVPGGWVERIRSGDRIKLRDARGAKREIRIVDVSQEGAAGEVGQSVYFSSGTSLRIRAEGRKRLPNDERTAEIGVLPEKPQRIRLRMGDRLCLTRKPSPGGAAENGRTAHIACSLPEVFTDVRAGESIWLDDGAIGGVIHEATFDCLTVEITQVSPEGAWLGADKGINLPDSELRLPALTEQDLEDLKFVASHADLVGYSFVSSADDVQALHSRLADLGRKDMGLILKIETRRAFDRLPEILLAALHRTTVGVMIARGDLAVECGFERLAEVQEEILWLCEAAHVPVVWATQVLENLAREGKPSRAEITDAAMGERAECVMLNKGPHMRETLRLLDGILRRMEMHQFKKQARLRPLRVARLFPENGQASHPDA